jgi:glycogen debranching enzyme
MRYGFVEQAQRLTLALLDAGVAFAGRYPELWSGFDREEFTMPLPYPTSCSPQAWAAASPWLLLRSLLCLQPDLLQGSLTVEPRLPKEFLPFRVENLRLGDLRLRIDVDQDGYRVEGLPAWPDPSPAETDRSSSPPVM